MQQREENIINMKRKNRIYQMCYRVVILVLGFLLFGAWKAPVHAAEQSGTCGVGLTWELSGDVLTISGAGEMSDFADGEFAPWYENAEEIGTINLTSGITSIGDLAFYGCSYLTGVSLPDTVISIGEYAFAECTALQQVHLGSGLQIIEEGAFIQCESLKAIFFPESLTEIGTKAFYRCNGITTVTVPSSVTSMGNQVFAYCENLVRAKVNAAIESLPEWTFYGCSSLTDVSLSSDIVAVGDYAFNHCENLNAVYTQSDSNKVAAEIQQDILQGNEAVSDTYVATYDMPDISMVIKEEFLVETKVTETEDCVITAKNMLDAEKIVIGAVVNNSTGWNKVVSEAKDAVRHGNTQAATVEVYLIGTVIEAADLAQFAGSKVLLRIITDGRVVWEIDMSQMEVSDFSGTYDLGIVITKADADDMEIKSENIYQLEFAGNVDFDVTLGIKVGGGYELASLYQKKLLSYDIIKTMLVDEEDYAWYSLANVDKNTNYFLALDVADVTMEDAVIPATMYEQYEEEEVSYLTDADGVTYRITGRSSKWGITGRQFAMYVGVAMAAMVLVVAIVMVTLNMLKKSREQYRMLEEEAAQRDAIDEEALRMEILREMIEGKDKGKD